MKAYQRYGAILIECTLQNGASLERSLPAAIYIKPSQIREISYSLSHGVGYWMPKNFGGYELFSKVQLFCSVTKIFFQWLWSNGLNPLTLTRINYKVK